MCGRRFVVRLSVPGPSKQSSACAGAVVAVAAGAAPPCWKTRSSELPLAGGTPGGQGMFWMRSQTAYAVPACTGSAVSDSLSLNGRDGSFASSARMFCWLCHVRPPSLDVAAPIEPPLSFASNEIVTAYAVPSGPMSTHGSDARSYGRPVKGSRRTLPE
jgi:hypothetical protein